MNRTLFMIKLSKFTTSLLILQLFVWIPLLTSSCKNGNCTSTNPVFLQNPPESEVYKETLAKQLSGMDKNSISYWFSEYKNVNGQECLVFQVKGKELCALIVVENEHWERLQDLRDKKGVSYRGAEFVNLQIETRRDSAGTRFFLRGFDEIID